MARARTSKKASKKTEAQGPSEASTDPSSQPEKHPKRNKAAKDDGMSAPSPFEDIQIPKLSFQARRRVRQALWGLAALCLPALFFFRLPGFPMNENAEVRFKAIFAIATLALLLARELSLPGQARKAGGALGIAAVLAVGIYFNLGTFHGHVYVHYWEQFHYTLGAKYYPELGHDGLYAASLEAQLESYPRSQLQPNIRDLRTNEVAASRAPETVEHRHEVVSRFTTERWRAFVSDHKHFLDINTPGYIAGIRKDHGFNPPPSWTFMARIFAALPAINGETLRGLATLDVLLLGALFVFIFRTYGSRIGCLSLVLFGINYAGRYYWVGGAFLREDWLAAVGIAICMLQKKRYRWAGALFGYATAVRIFPVLFLFGPGILALRALTRRERPRWALDLGVGFTLALLVAAGAGSLTGRGPAAWTDFAAAINLHKDTWLTNNVGLENVLLYDQETFDRKLVSFSLPEPWIHWQAKMDQLKKDKAPLLWAAKLLMLLLTAAAAWRLDLARAAVLGIVVVFTMVLTTCYYWQMLLLIPLLRNRPLLYTTLFLNLGIFALHFKTVSFEMRYGMFSWGLLAVFVATLAPLAWATLRSNANSSQEKDLQAA